MGKPKCMSEVTGLDSGWSWIIAAACCFVNCMLYGVTRLSGMLLQPAVETFAVSRGEAAVPFTTSSAVRNLSGPIVGVLGQHFGIRPVTAAGCILAALGAGLCFFATDVIWATVFWGGIFGIGLGLSTSLLPSAINQNFQKNAATASGISYAGSFIGSFIFPPLVLLLLEEYGLHGTFLILSGFILNALVAVVLLKPPCMPRSNSNKKPIYTINNRRNITDCGVFKPVGIDDPVMPNVTRQLSNTREHEVVIKDVENTENDIYNITKSYPVLDIKELSEKSAESFATDILEKTEISEQQFLGFLAFTKTSKSKLEDLKISSPEKEKQTFFSNFLFSDVVQKIREHLTKNKNRCFSEKSAKTNGMVFELSDSQRNIFLVTQLSDHSTTALIQELRNNCDRSDNNNLPKKNHEDLILLVTRQDGSITNELEMCTKLQKFITSKVITKNIVFSHSQNCLKRDEMQLPGTEDREKSTPKCNEHIGPETCNSASDASNISILARLTRSFKRRTSRARANMLRKSLSLDSKKENPPNVESPCPQCRMPVKEEHMRQDETNSFAVPVSFTDPNHNSVSLENASKLISESNSLQCNCASFNTLPSKVVLKNGAEEYLDITVMPEMMIFLNKEKFLKDVPPESERHFRQADYAAILLLQSTQNNRACKLNRKMSSNRANVAKLNKENRNISDPFPDQNQNFLDMKDVANVRDSKTGDYSVVVINAEDPTPDNFTFRRRLRSWCSVFSNPMFLLISVTMAIFSFIMVCIITVIEDYARDIDHPNIPKPYVLMVLSAADLCGTLGLGWITDRRFLTRKNFIAICFFGMAACTMIMAFTTQVITLCALVGAYGLFESGVIITFPLLTAQFIRVDKQTIAIASSNLLSAPAILLVPLVIGYFRDLMGSYHKLFYVLSVTSSACGCLWLLVPFLLQKYSMKFRGGFS